MKTSWYDHIVVIDRSIWRCGRFGEHMHPSDSKDYTKMLDEHGFMCCLGQACKSGGIHNVHQYRKRNPVEVAKTAKSYGQSIDSIKYLLSEDLHKESAFAEAAIDINDDVKLSRSGRELSLFMLGKKHRVFIQFTGSYTDGWSS